MIACAHCSTVMESYATVCPGCGATKETIITTEFVGFGSIIGGILSWGILTYGIYWILNWMFGLPFLVWILGMVFISYVSYRHRYNTVNNYIWHR